MPWFLYLLECADGTFYAGISNRLEQRLETHNRGAGAKYTRGRLPVSLIAFKEFPDRSSASKAEFELKKRPRADKKDYFKL